jgi:hypothetical protein
VILLRFRPLHAYYVWAAGQGNRLDTHALHLGPWTETPAEVVTEAE